MRRLIWALVCFVVVMMMASNVAAQCEILTNKMPEPQLNMFSSEDDVKEGKLKLHNMEANLSVLVNAPVSVFYDPELSGYINKIAERLRASAPDYAKAFSYRSWLYDREPPNALNLGGGMMVISLGTIIDAESEDQIVGTIAHEIGHSALRHASVRKTLESMYNFEDRLLTLEFTSPRWKRGPEDDKMIKLVHQNLSERYAQLGEYRVKQESEADFFAVRTMIAAGYNPSSFSKEYARKADGEGRGWADWGSHPSSFLRTLLIECEMKGRTFEPEQKSVEFLAAKKRAQELLASPDLVRKLRFNEAEN